MSDILFMYFYYNNTYDRMAIAEIAGGREHMGMTMTQKILAAHAGLDKVEAGQ